MGNEKPNPESVVTKPPTVAVTGEEFEAFKAEQEARVKKIETAHKAAMTKLRNETQRTIQEREREIETYMREHGGDTDEYMKFQNTYRQTSQTREAEAAARQQVVENAILRARLEYGAPEGVFEGVTEPHDAENRALRWKLTSGKGSATVTSVNTPETPPQPEYTANPGSGITQSPSVPTELKQGIKQMADGEVAFDPKAARQLFEELRRIRT